VAYRIRELTGVERRIFAPLAWVIEADDGVVNFPEDRWMYLAGFRDLATLDEYVRMTRKEIAR